MEIKALCKELQEDFFSLFDSEQFAHEESWKSCVCRFYHTSCDYPEWMKRSKEDNIEDAKKAIANHQMAGFLAYDDGKCIGWMNMADARLYDRLVPYLPKQYLDGSAVLTICYVISKQYRNQKIASLLLEHGIEEYRKQGFRYAIAIPIAHDVREKSYRGHPLMYEHRGYVQEIVSEDVKLYVKQLF